MPLPPVRIVERGVLRKDIEDDFLTRSRTRIQNGVDLKAMVGANNAMARRIQALAQRYGADVVVEALRSGHRHVGAEAAQHPARDTGWPLAVREFHRLLRREPAQDVCLPAYPDEAGRGAGFRFHEIVRTSPGRGECDVCGNRGLSAPGHARHLRLCRDPLSRRDPAHRAHRSHTRYHRQLLLAGRRLQGDHVGHPERLASGNPLPQSDAAGERRPMPAGPSPSRAAT